MIMKADKLTLIIIVWLSLVLWAGFNLIQPDFDGFIASANEPFEIKVWHFLLLMLWIATGGTRRK